MLCVLCLTKRFRSYNTSYKTFAILQLQNVCGLSSHGWSYETPCCFQHRKYSSTLETWHKFSNEDRKFDDNIHVTYLTETNLSVQKSLTASRIQTETINCSTTPRTAAVCTRKTKDFILRVAKRGHTLRRVHNQQKLQCLIEHIFYRKLYSTVKISTSPFPHWSQWNQWTMEIGQTKRRPTLRCLMYYTQNARSISALKSAKPMDAGKLQTFFSSVL